MASEAKFLMAQFLEWIEARPRSVEQHLSLELRLGRCAHRQYGGADPRRPRRAHSARPRASGGVFVSDATTDTSHDALIRDQFTRQATVFNTAVPIASEDALKLIVEACRPGPDDRVLDVACGGGLVARAFAPHVRHATGIDVTPAMLDTARQASAEKGLDNLTWDQGDVTTLPYADGAFTIVATRFSFHHFLDPLGVLKEMVRVCASGGRIVVADSCPSEDKEKAAAFNRLELLRDPSHTRALPLSEMKALFAAAGLGEPRVQFSELRDVVNNLLARSYPNPGDDRRIVAMFRASASDDSLGIPVRLDGEAIHYAYPVAICAAVRP